MNLAALILSIYGGLFASSGLGYDPGLGVAGEYEHQWERVGVVAEGTLTNKKKTVADNGYTYSAGAFGRAYFTPWRVFIEGGALYGDYNSKWRKTALWPVIGVGGEQWNLRYAFRENDTENETESLTGRLIFRITKHNRIRVDTGIVWFTDDGRERGYTAALMWGWAF